MSLNRIRRAVALAAVLAAMSQFAVRAAGHAKLGPPPKATEPYPRIPESGEMVRASVPSINVGNRAEVVSFFNTFYLPTQGVDAQWTGNVASCSPGTTSIPYREATLQRVNYFRAMTGLPGNVALNATWNSQCQQAALMMIAEGDLSHSPGPTWACYTTDGATAAGKSNLALGADGPDAIDLYIDDPGAGNSVVGHRRWILYPPQQTMGTGSTTGNNGYYYGSNALWVFGGAGTRPATPEWVSWPPPGYVPFQLVYGRWSFSYPNADFSNATITMTHKGNPVTLTKAPVVNGYGDNTVVWEPSGIPGGKPSQDLTYTVQLSGVVIAQTPRQFVYDVIVIDPDAVVETGVRTRTWELYR